MHLLVPRLEPNFSWSELASSQPRELTGTQRLPEVGLKVHLRARFWTLWYNRNKGRKAAGPPKQHHYGQHTDEDADNVYAGVDQAAV